MAKKLFGTDGIRGRAGEFPLDPRTVVALGMALAEDLDHHRNTGPVLIGMDTRESGPAIAAQLAYGLRAVGTRVSVEFAGVLTTPGVAYLTRTGHYPAGVMISASHNPFEDNGIKVFAHSGFKLPDGEEHEVEEAIFRLLPDVEAHGPRRAAPNSSGTPAQADGAARSCARSSEAQEPPNPAPEIGGTTRSAGSGGVTCAYFSDDRCDIAPLTASIGPQPYLDFLLSTLSAPASGRPLAGLRIVLDCGNGAASALAPDLFRQAGADVTAIHSQPNGRNINLNCGALHVESLRAQVLANGADAGVAFDGDADRVMLVAPSGRIVDGDAMLLIAARRLQADGHLPGNLVISTVMSNLGLEKALDRLGIAMPRTPVGDKYVLEEMVRRGAALGGEQSGHIIFREYATTGDGILTALKVLETAVVAGATLDDLTADLIVYPQLLVNVRVKERRPLQQLPRVTDEIRACEAELNGSGRILVRYSGTEPLLRVMVEGLENGHVRKLADRVTAAIHADLG
jgi:phosphoglucosamine mutase